MGHYGPRLPISYCKISYYGLGVLMDYKSPRTNVMNMFIFSFGHKSGIFCSSFNGRADEGKHLTKASIYIN